jgi:hypothetical protein
LVRRADVIARRLPDRTVLLNGSTGSCFELNPVGTLIWEQFDGARSLDDIAQQVATRFGLGPTTASADVQAFAQALTAANLVQTVGA